MARPFSPSPFPLLVRQHDRNAYHHRILTEINARPVPRSSWLHTAAVLALLLGALVLGALAVL